MKCVLLRVWAMKLPQHLPHLLKLNTERANMTFWLTAMVIGVTAQYLSCAVGLKLIWARNLQVKFQLGRLLSNLMILRLEILPE